MTASTVSIAPADTTNTTAYPEGATLRGVVDSAEPAFARCVGLEGTMSHENSTHFAGGDNDAVDVPVEVKEAFIINSRERAEWLLGKLANNAAAKSRIKAQAAAMIAQLDADTQHLTQRHGADLEAWARQEVDKTGGKRKSVHTLQGTLAFRTVPSRLRLSDENELTLWAYENRRTDLYAVEYKALPGAMEAAKQHLEETGELLPGVEVVDARESFKVTFKGEAESDGEGV